MKQNIEGIEKTISEIRSLLEKCENLYKEDFSTIMVYIKCAKLELISMEKYLKDLKA